MIVTWNVRDLLRACLRSILEDGVPDWADVVVVDNASPDGTADMVAAEFPWAKLVRTGQNLGFSRGNNLALAACESRYALLLNPDTEVRPGVLRRMVDHLESHPRCAVVAPRQVCGEGRTRYDAAVAFPTVWNNFCDLALLSTLFPRSRWFNGRMLGDWDHEDDRDVPAVAGSAMMVRREALREVGPLDETMFVVEDVELCLRLHQAGWTVHYLGTATVVHLGGASMQRGGPSGLYWQISYQSFWIYLRKHRRFGAARLLPVVTFLWGTTTLVLGSLAALVPGGGPERAATLAKWRGRAIHMLRWSLSDKRRFQHHLAAAPSDSR